MDSPLTNLCKITHIYEKNEFHFSNDACTHHTVLYNKRTMGNVNFLALPVKWSEISALEPIQTSQHRFIKWLDVIRQQNIIRDNIDPDLYCLMARRFSLIYLISYRVILHHNIKRVVVLFSQCLSQLEFWLVSRRQHLLLDALYITCIFKYLITTKLSKCPLHNTAVKNILLIHSS